MHLFRQALPLGRALRQFRHRVHPVLHIPGLENAAQLFIGIDKFFLFFCGCLNHRFFKADHFLSVKHAFFQRFHLCGGFFHCIQVDRQRIFLHALCDSAQTFRAIAVLRTKSAARHKRIVAKRIFLRLAQIAAKTNQLSQIHASLHQLRCLMLFCLQSGFITGLFLVCQLLNGGRKHLAQRFHNFVVLIFGRQFQVVFQRKLCCLPKLLFAFFGCKLISATQCTCLLSAKHSVSFGHGLCQPLKCLLIVCIDSIEHPQLPRSSHFFAARQICYLFQFWQRYTPKRLFRHGDRQLFRNAFANVPSDSGQCPIIIRPDFDRLHIDRQSQMHCQLIHGAVFFHTCMMEAVVFLHHLKEISSGVAVHRQHL